MHGGAGGRAEGWELTVADALSDTNPVCYFTKRLALAAWRMWITFTT
jgi:hypothetical protein